MPRMALLEGVFKEMILSKDQMKQDSHINSFVENSTLQYQQGQGPEVGTISAYWEQ